MAKKKTQTKSGGAQKSFSVAVSQEKVAREDLRGMKESFAVSRGDVELSREEAIEHAKGVSGSLADAHKQATIEAKERQIERLERETSVPRRLAKGAADALHKLGKKRMKKPRRILRKKQLGVNLGSSSYRAPSVLGDENRFFKGTMEQEKRSMFFS